MQVLQYEEAAGTWSEIGKMEKARDWHGVVEIDSSLLCSGIVGQNNKIKLLLLGNNAGSCRSVNWSQFGRIFRETTVQLHLYKSHRIMWQENQKSEKVVEEEI